MNAVTPRSHMKSMIAAVCFIVASAAIDGTAGEKSGSTTLKVMITRSFDHIARYYSHEIVIVGINSIGCSLV